MVTLSSCRWLNPLSVFSLIALTALVVERSYLLNSCKKASEYAVFTPFQHVPSLNTTSKPTNTESEVDHLYQLWNEAYRLQASFPPKSLSSLNSDLSHPIAPHLEDCHRSFLRNKKSERRKQDGSLPDWAVPRLGLSGYNPPWVQGSDEDNVPLTRFLQTEIWKRQFPKNCSDPNLSFAIVQWLPVFGHGLGSALHVMSSHMAVAFGQRRILVPVPNTFERANINECRGRHHGSFECFFFPITSAECEKQAMSLWQSAGNNKTLELLLEPRVVHLHKIYKLGERHPLFKGLGDPWLQEPLSVEVLGEVMRIVKKMSYREIDGRLRPWKEVDGQYQLVSWWHAQAIRFFLRAPTEYMCHYTNRVRQQAYGRRVAALVLRSKPGLDLAMAEANRSSAKDVAFLEEAQAIMRKQSLNRTLEGALWWQLEPFVPRPIVSMHVRQGDKGSEMHVFSLSAYMWLAERLRRRAPSLEHVWLSTEMESVVEDARKFPSWKFLFTVNKRQTGNMTMHNYTSLVGVKELTLLSFSNLIISSQCDYFLGALASNWNRLINELRQTNGRFRAGYLTVNFDEY